MAIRKAVSAATSYFYMHFATDFSLVGGICRNIVFLSLQLGTIFSKKFGTCEKSPYLCIVERNKRAPETQKKNK